MSANYQRVKRAHSVVEPIGLRLAFSASVWYLWRSVQKLGVKVSEFIVVLKPSPFGPDPNFRRLRIEPQFDNVAAYFRSGHIELRLLQTPPVQIGDTITLHFEVEAAPMFLKSNSNNCAGIGRRPSQSLSTGHGFFVTQNTWPSSAK